MFSNNQAESNFIKSLYIENFRNHKSLEIQASKSSIVIYGKMELVKQVFLRRYQFFQMEKD